MLILLSLSDIVVWIWSTFYGFLRLFFNSFCGVAAVFDLLGVKLQWGALALWVGVFDTQWCLDSFLLICRHMEMRTEENVAV